jgi:hypothetical protein
MGVSITPLEGSTTTTCVAESASVEEEGTMFVWAKQGPVKPLRLGLERFSPDISE